MAPRRDRISQLPVDILDHILGLLPIQDAAKTAILSTSWRDVWLSLTHLNFDDNFFRYIGKKHRHYSNFVGLYVTNKVLLQHNGTIRKFVLSFYKVGVSTFKSRSYDFDQLLPLVTRKGVEEIYIRFVCNIYTLPNCIFSCVTLKRLHLSGVIIEPTNFPRILPNVASLCLEYIDFGPMNLLDWTIDFPVLKNLSFLRCQNVFSFNITAPKLSSLTIKSCSSDVLGKVLPISLDLRSISTLDLENSLQEFGEVFTRMGFQLNVEYLKLSGFNELYRRSGGTSSAFVHLLRLCPQLCKLDIDLSQIYPMDSKCLDALSKALGKLHDVAQTNKMLHTLKLTPFRESQSEILFIKELLTIFSTLEKVIIIRDNYYCKKESTRIIQELLDFPLVSTKAKIILEG